jgi:PIN domain nuclease of toxin-antitoxin system
VILLDTHVIVWLMEGARRLSARAERETGKADTLLVSPVSCWELGTLFRLNRIALDREVHRWIADLFDEDRIALAPLSPEAATGAGLLPASFPGDPADRLLYATARELVVPLVTKDAPIRAYALEARDVRAIW